MVEMRPLSERIKVYPRNLIQDDRGWFLKVITGKEEELPSHTGEVYLTMGRKGQSKGGHYHPEAFEWFALISGNATLKLEDMHTHERLDIRLSMADPKVVFVPNNIAHVIENNSDQDFILLAYTDKLYDPSDTISYNVL